MLQYLKGSGSQYTVCVSLAWRLKVHRVITGRKSIYYGHKTPNLYKNIVHGDIISLIFSTYTYEHIHMYIILEFVSIVTNISLTGKKITRARSQLCQNIQLSKRWNTFRFVNYTFCVNN